MAAVRRNILTDETARKNYIQGVKLLKQEQLGPTTADLGIPGPPVQVSTYDLFVAWHHLAMDTFTPPTQSDRNAAHRGPVFLPWHRTFLSRLEEELQRVTADAQTALPYWDWAADGELPADEQRRRRCGTFSVRRRATWSPGRWRRCRSGCWDSRCSSGRLSPGR